MEGYVTKQTFQWTVGIIIIVFMAVAGGLYNKVDATQTELNVYKDSQYKLLMDMNGNMASMSSDISWIKQTLSGYEIEK